MKQVFRFLIVEAPYLIDDKAIERCLDASPKEQLKIKIDSVRKSLGIEDMADVELLVNVMYKYQSDHKEKLAAEERRMAEEEQEEIESGQLSPDQVATTNNDPKKISNEPTLNGNGE